MLMREWTRVVAVTKENQQDILLNEMLRERASVLSRAGFAVEEALARLSRIDQRITSQMDQLTSLREEGATRLASSTKRMIFEEINARIDEFNEACKKAELQFYYLIVTREAMGLRRHETVKKLYVVPPKKKKIQVV